MPSVLKKLGAMTSLRDTYLVEQSLLRTLGPLLGVLNTSLFRIDVRGNVVRALYHSRSVVVEDEHQSMVENIKEVTNDQEVPAHIHHLISTVQMLSKPCGQKAEDGLVICYPIFGKNEQLGYFVFQRDRELTHVEDAVTHGILEVFTNYFDLLDASQRDQLTGLLNRHSLESNLDRLWNILSVRQHASDVKDSKRVIVPESYWLCVIDIDHFKSINDTYGHMIGDEVLILVARQLQASFRQADLLYRYGGEEFIAIVAASDIVHATQIFERARKRIEKCTFPQVGHVTFSGGFCKADPTVLPHEVISRADCSLYAAKNAGRNRVYFYDQLVKEGVLKEVKAGDVDLF